MAFIHAPIDLGYQSLKSITKPSGRTYETPEGNIYPSMTTVLSRPLKKKEKPKVSISKERAEKSKMILAFACARGEIVHKLCEDYLNNLQDFEKGFPDFCLNSFHQIKEILDERVGVIHGLELPLYSDELKIAGRVDLVAEFDGVLSIIDFKTSKKEKSFSEAKKFFLQEAGYALMLKERTGLEARQLVTIVACDCGSTQIFKESLDDWKGDLVEKIRLKS